MHQSDNSLDAPKMRGIFDQFGKSVTQMLELTMDHQIAIDELRNQLRLIQTQVDAVTTAMADFEDKLFEKVQQMRPVIYTRDGIPFDDVLDLLQTRVNKVTETSVEHHEQLARIDNELKEKVETQIFEETIKETKSVVSDVGELTMSIHNLQKDFQKQHEETDRLTERIMSMVDVRLQQEQVKQEMEIDDNSFVTKGYLESELNKIKMEGVKTFSFNNIPDDPEEARIYLEEQHALMEEEYAKSLAKLNEMVDFDFDEFSEFDFDFDEERELQDRGDGMPDGDVYVRESCGGRRKDVGTQMLVSQQVSSRLPMSSREAVDESKIAQSVSSSLYQRLGNLLVEVLSTQTLGGVKINKTDAKQIIENLTNQQKYLEDVGKLKLLIRMKMDQVPCEQALEARVTKEELFKYLLMIFPNNTTIQKLAGGCDLKLPQLQGNATKRSSEVSRPSTSISRAPKTTQKTDLVPARSSRLLALNQRYLKGADGKYYLRDVGVDIDQLPEYNRPSTSLATEASFDFQPFVPAGSIRPSSTSERITVSTSFRSRTPPRDED